jgi:hypothetical protein
MGISSMEKGKEMKKRIKPLTESVQEYRLPYIPCRMFKNEKFGGFVAENYRALTMLSPWIFRCLLDKKFSPPLPVLPSHAKPRDKWTMKEKCRLVEGKGCQSFAKRLSCQADKSRGRLLQPAGPSSSSGSEHNSIVYRNASLAVAAVLHLWNAVLYQLKRRKGRKPL